MAATFYAQVLARWRWEAMKAACDTAYSLWLEERGRYTILQASDEVHAEVTVDGITAVCEMGSYDEGPSATCVLGTVLSDYPSGRLYAPWSAIPDNVRERDAAFGDALEKAAQKYGGWIETGEGDPNDLYFTVGYDIALPEA